MRTRRRTAAAGAAVALVGALLVGPAAASASAEQGAGTRSPASGEGGQPTQTKVATIRAMNAAIWSCMTVTGQVPDGATRTDVLGSVNVTNGKQVPAASPVPVSRGCMVAAATTVRSAVQGSVGAAASGLKQRLTRLRTRINSHAATVQPAAVADNDTQQQSAGVAPLSRPSKSTFIGAMNGLYNITLDYFMDYRTGQFPSYFNWSSDGCTGGPDYPFLDACFRHDFGWRNLHRADSWYGGTPPMWRTHNKAVADSQFKDDMGSICGFWGIFTNCYTLADIYYQVVCHLHINTCGLHPTAFET